MKINHFKIVLSLAISLTGYALRAQQIPDPGNDPLESVAAVDSAVQVNRGSHFSSAAQDLSLKSLAGGRDAKLISSPFSIPSLVYFPGELPVVVFNLISEKSKGGLAESGNTFN